MKNKLAALSLAAILAGAAAAPADATELDVGLSVDAYAHDQLLVAVATVETIPGFELRGRLLFLRAGNVIEEAPVITDSMRRIGFVLGASDRRADICVRFEGELRILGASLPVADRHCEVWTPRLRAPGRGDLAVALDARAGARGLR